MIVYIPDNLAIRAAAALESEGLRFVQTSDESATVRQDQAPAAAENAEAADNA